MTDIVERLKADEQYKWRSIMREAAAEIERLRSLLENAETELNICRPYRSLFASQAKELVAVRAERDRLRAALDDFAEQDCTYPHQPCLSVHPSILGHGVCDGCKARMALQESIGAKEENNS